MNDKFFDLTKEKQDRIINSAIKVFALHGFERASTDVIVKEACISKGLLFHYFVSKVGLYEFIYNYCIRYMNMELSHLVNEGERDYFSMLQRREYAKLQIMKNYPYMQLFFDQLMEEEILNDSIKIKQKQQELAIKNKERLQYINQSLFQNFINFYQFNCVVEWTITGLLKEHIKKPDFSPTTYYKEVMLYLDMLKKISYT